MTTDDTSLRCLVSAINRNNATALDIVIDCVSRSGRGWAQQAQKCGAISDGMVSAIKEIKAVMPTELR